MEDSVSVIKDIKVKSESRVTNQGKTIKISIVLQKFCHI